MKKVTRRRGTKLFRLYFSYAMEKTTVLVLVASLILLVGLLYLISNPWLDSSIYLENFKSIHSQYFKQGIFILGIFNSLIIAMLGITLGVNSISFDSLFISYNNRGGLCLRKLLVGYTILLILTLVEGLILFGVPTLFYSKFKMDKKLFMVLAYLFGLGAIEYSASLMLSTLIKSTMIPLMLAFISVTFRLITDSFIKITRIVRDIIPIIEVNDTGFICESRILIIFWVVGLALAYIFLYEMKDLKEISA